MANECGEVHARGCKLRALRCRQRNTTNSVAARLSDDL
jgi:hypothetical protein